MRTVSLRLVDMQRVVVPIGFVDENLHTQVRIDCKKLFEEYPSAIPSLAVHPPKGDAYPAVVTRDGDWVIWDISNSDVQSEEVGEFQLSFTTGQVVCKSYIGKYRVNESIMPNGSVPTPIQNWITEANTVLGEIPQDISDGIDDAMGAISAEAETLQPGSSASASFANKVLTIGVPKGDKGDPGEAGKDGKDGQDGHSPVVTASKSGKVTTVSVDGSAIATINDGEDGQNGQDGKDGKDGADGQDGQDGYSPTVAVTEITGGHTVTVTDNDGDHTFNVMDGDPTTIIDDTAGSGDTGKAWSADKEVTELAKKYEKPVSGIPASDLASGVIPDISGKADKTDTVLETTLSRGRKPNTTVGNYSFAFGSSIEASGENSHAEGAGTKATGTQSHAEGAGTTASGGQSHAQGSTTTASGVNSHAQGSSTTASGANSHAEGDSTTASNSQAHAEGSGTTASGVGSHAEGGGTVASGVSSHAEGGGTIANHKCQHVGGEFNVADPSENPSNERGDYVEIIGNGTYSVRSNARTLDWDGNEELAGDLTIKKGTADETSVSSLLNEIDTKAPVIESSASGAIVTLTDAVADEPLTGCVVQINPVQASGTPSPESPLPITGWTGCNVSRTGKNLLDLSAVVQGNYDGAVVDNNCVTDGYFPIKGGENYVWSSALSSIGGRYLRFYNSNKTYLSDENISLYGTGDKTFTAPTKAVFYRAMWYRNTGITPSDITADQIELGSSASTYEAYAGQTYPVTWQTEAGTVYGGSLNLTTGVLTVTWHGQVLKGTEPWALYSNSVYRFAVQTSNGFPNKKAGKTNVISDRFDVGGYNSNNYVAIMSEQSASYADADALKTYLATQYANGTPAMICYELNTPVTYQLSNVEIKTLLANPNNIWADTGDISVSYKADTKAYVDQNEGVKDVQVNGSSVVTNGVANVPVGNTSSHGVVKESTDNLGVGIYTSQSQLGNLYVKKATDYQVKQGTSQFCPVVPSNQHKSVFYGLAKLAGADMSGSSNAVGTFTDEAKLKIQQMIGLWTPRYYLKQTVQNDVTTYGTTDLVFNNEPLNIWEEFVVTIYRGDTTSEQNIATADWNLIYIHDNINNNNLLRKGYAKGDGPVILKYKRLPNALVTEMIQSDKSTLFSQPRNSDYVDRLGYLYFDSSSNLIKAGTTFECYIHRFI